MTNSKSKAFELQNYDFGSDIENAMNNEKLFRHLTINHIVLQTFTNSSVQMFKSQLCLQI